MDGEHSSEVVKLGKLRSKVIMLSDGVDTRQYRTGVLGGVAT